MSNASRTGRPRGRPTRSDLLEAHAGGGVPVRLRAAWLLRVCRVHNADSRWCNLTAFTRELHKHGFPGLNASTVSRWETGATRVPFAAVRAYESVLGLHPHSLTAVMDTVFRYYAVSEQTAQFLDRGVPDDRIARREMRVLLDRAVGQDVMAGADWDELTALALAHPSMAQREDHLADAVRRLLPEVIISDGLSWMQRYEAFNRLLSHTSLSAEAVAALREVVDDGGIQSTVGTACMFDASATPEAARHVLRHLDQPRDDRVFKGSLMACVRKIKCGHFQGPQIMALSDTVAALLSDGGDQLGAETRALAVSVLRQIPPRLRNTPAVNALGRLKHDQGSASVLQDNRLRDRKLAIIEATRAANYVMAHTQTLAEGYVDSFLPLLIEELLFDPVFDIRLYAAALIRVSPYRPAVAKWLASGLATAIHNEDQVWLTVLLEALRQLGGPEERRLVERLVVDPSIATPIADVAAYALGHIGGTSLYTYWDAALARHRAAWLRSANQMSASTLDRLVYAMGMADARDPLRNVQTDLRLPSGVRASATWWLSQSATTVESVRSTTK